MIEIGNDLSPVGLQPKLRRLFELSASKIRAIENSWDPARGAPVFTAAGQYTSRGWTEWTQGFQYGSAFCNSTLRARASFWRTAASAPYR